MGLINTILKKYFWALTLCFLGLSAYLTAGVFTSAISGKLQAASPSVLSAQVQRPKPPPPRNTILRMIVDRSLFNSAAVGQNLIGQGHSEAVETDLNVELNGTVIWGEHGRYAIITDRGSKLTEVYTLGDTLLADATIMAIDSGVVTIDRSGEQQILRQIPYYSGKNANSSTSIGRSRSTGTSSGSPMENSVEEVGDGEFNVAREFVDQMIENPAALAGQIRGRPVEDGFKFGRIPKNSPLSQMGLKRGDIVTSINGRPANNTAELLRLMADLGTTSSITIDVDRGGQTIPLTINLR
ncbi:MAG: type II secretion system protein N [Candidatus Alcyoniella australis]|nr:type II secretion system protein N [Candidatus Alcyoniella australis]